VNRAQALTEELQRSIPLTAAMQVRVLECSARHMSMHAPLTANYNVHGTGFAGSLATLATICGWALAREAGLASEWSVAWVIRQSRAEFLAPARGDLVASAELSAAVWRAFMRRAKLSERPRLRIVSRVHSLGSEVLIHHGTFVALTSM
jgi:thioesterase domain-containing protein